MENKYNHYPIKGPVSREELSSIVDNCMKNIGGTVQEDCGGFMLLENSLFLNNNGILLHKGLQILPKFHEEELIRPALSLKSFIEGKYSINETDQLLLLFGSIDRPEIWSESYGCGFSAMYISRINSGEPVVSTPDPSSKVYAEGAFLKATGAKKKDKLIDSSYRIPYLPGLRLVG